MPTVRGLEQAFSGQVTLVRVNILTKESIPLQQEYGFTATPEFFLVDDDEKILGHWDEGTFTQLKQAISHILVTQSRN